MVYHPDTIRGVLPDQRLREISGSRKIFGVRSAFMDTFEFPAAVELFIQHRYTDLFSLCPDFLYVEPSIAEDPKFTIPPTKFLSRELIKSRTSGSMLKA